MNANDLIADLELEPSWTGEERTILLRALRLLSAAEANDGTPETDALHHRLVKASEGPQWIAGKDYCDMKDHARTLEQRCAALAARVRELDEERCCTCRDGTLKQPYSTMPPLQTLPWGAKK